MTRSSRLTLALVLGLAILPAVARAETTPPDLHRCEDPIYRRLDFLVGDWDVHDAAGRLVGRDTVARAFHGCALEGAWVDAGGRASGTSLHGYDWRSRGWLAFVVDNDGLALVLRGALVPDGVVLHGERTLPNGRALERVTWTASARGPRRVWDYSLDGGRSWTVRADWSYRRHGDGVSARHQPNPRCQTAPRRDFDFWLGDWDVRDAAGVLQGHNVISRAHDGCVVRESWTSTTDEQTGVSLNVYDAGEREWRHLWVDSWGNTLALHGGKRPEGMIELGQRRTPTGELALERTLWKPTPGGGAHQLWEYSLDAGYHWVVRFDAGYTRREAAARAGATR